MAQQEQTNSEEENVLTKDKSQTVFFLREDSIDRLPGFKNWKLISFFGLLICAGLFIVGLISGTDNEENRDHYPLCGLHLIDIHSGQPKAYMWNLIHFVGYFISALVFPDSWGVIWLWGLTWETFEANIGWHDWCDIAYNTAGIALGVAVRKLLIPAGQKLQVVPADPIVTTPTTTTTTTADGTVFNAGTSTGAAFPET